MLEFVINKRVNNLNGLYIVVWVCVVLLVLVTDISATHVIMKPGVAMNIGSH